jgi:hypothetical protein
MTLANGARVVVVLAAVVAAIGSASSNQGQGSAGTSTSPYQQPGYSPPPPQQMEPARALGLWRSTFGAVKIEADDSRGGIESGALQGIWVYQRQGEEVIGYFHGSLRGNVLELDWQEPSNPPLTGKGYLVFDPSGRQYSGRWWSERRDRVGDWNGWRSSAADGTSNGWGRTPPASGPDRRDQYDDRYDQRDDGYNRRDDGYGRDDRDDRRDHDPRYDRRDPRPAPPPNTHGPQPRYY